MKQIAANFSTILITTATALLLVQCFPKLSTFPTISQCRMTSITQQLFQLIAADFRSSFGSFQIAAYHTGSLVKVSDLKQESH